MTKDWWTPARLALHDWRLCPFTGEDAELLGKAWDAMPGFKQMGLGVSYEFLCPADGRIYARRLA